MNLYQFATTLYNRIGRETLHEFVIELFESASNNELYLTIDTVKGWFRSERPTKSFLKQLRGGFNEARFHAFLKSRTLGIWKELMNDFVELTSETDYSAIDFISYNHDVFIDNLEWQFKTILRLPIITEYEPDYLTISVNIDGDFLGYHPSMRSDSSIRTQFSLLINIDETLNIERSPEFTIHEKWVVATDLSVEQLLTNRFLDDVHMNLRKGMRLCYFTYENERHDEIQDLTTKFTGYLHNIKAVSLSREPSNINFFHIPKLGYIFYFAEVHGEISIFGYEFHKFHGTSHYKAFRMHDDIVDEVTFALRKIEAKQQ